jgi:hypothetical protein
MLHPVFSLKADPTGVIYLDFSLSPTNLKLDIYLIIENLVHFRSLDTLIHCHLDPARDAQQDL